MTREPSRWQPRPIKPGRNGKAYLCDQCGTPGATPAVQTSPINYSQTRRLLCAKCRGRLGWSQPLDNRVEHLNQ